MADEWKVVDIEPGELEVTAGVPVKTRIYLKGLHVYGTVVEEASEVWRAELGKTKSYWFSRDEAVEAVKDFMREHSARIQSGRG